MSTTNVLKTPGQISVTGIVRIQQMRLRGAGSVIMGILHMKLMLGIIQVRNNHWYLLIRINNATRHLTLKAVRLKMFQHVCHVLVDNCRIQL